MPSLPDDKQYASERGRRLPAAHLETLLAVREVLTSARTLEEAIPGILQSLGETMEWVTGEYWSVDAGGRALSCLAAWHARGFRSRALEAAARRLTMAPGVGLLGRAWESGQALWVADVQKDPLFLRRKAAERSGIRGAYAFPLSVKDAGAQASAGAVAFFATRETSHDPPTLALLSGLGGEIGQFAERCRSERLREGESRLLELIAAEAPLPEILDRLTRLIESQAPGMVCSVLLLDEDGVHIRHGAAPSLPEAYNLAVDGAAIGPSAGSCGTAMYRRELVIVTDVRTDPLWADYQDLGLPAELRACWSTPILARGGAVLGTFAVYYREAREPTEAELRLFDVATHLAGIAIERSRERGALRRQQERFHYVALATRDAIYEWDVPTGAVWRNDTYQELYSAEELVGSDESWWEEHLHPDDRQAVLESLRAAFREAEESWAHEYRLRRADGSYATVVDRGHILYDESGQPSRMIGAITDVTEWRRAQETLRASEERFTKAFRASPAPMAITRQRDGVFVDANAAYLALCQYPRDELIGRSSGDLGMVDPAVREQIRQRLLAAGRLRDLELELRTKSGDTRQILLSLEATELGGEPCTLGAVVDITDRKRAEAALRESEERFRTLVEHAPYGIFRSTPAGRFLAVNPALVQMLGYDSAEEVLGLDLPTAVYADRQDRDRALAASERDDYVTFEAIWKRRDGTTFLVRLTGRALRNPDRTIECFETIVEDVTEQRELEARLRQSQKLEAIGRLAGGVAHDFNNLLTAIMGYCDLLLASSEPPGDWRADLGEILGAARRAAALTQQLLAFSRKQMLKPQVLDVNALLGGVSRMLGRLIGENVELVTELDPTVGYVRADPAQLEQVVVNLAVNARDAMPGGGRITVETTALEVPAGGLPAERELVAPGAYVVITVSDTGAGMDDATQARIFEPFFSTKARGEGTGLGLATAYGIVKQSDGYIWVDSARGEGTTFEVYLPSVQGPASAEVEPLPEPRAGRGETVLLVEDDPVVRSVVEAILERHGYLIVAAEGPEAALAAVARMPGQVDLILTDVVMPEMSGPELVERLAAQLPDAKILYMSGYADGAAMRNGVLETGDAFLQKPFTSVEVARKVREVLDAG